MKNFQRKTNHGKKFGIDVDCDEVLQQIGGSRLWQLINFLLLCLPTMASGFLVLSFVFTGSNYLIFMADKANNDLNSNEITELCDKTHCQHY